MQNKSNMDHKFARAGVSVICQLDADVETWTEGYRESGQHKSQINTGCPLTICSEYHTLTGWQETNLDSVEMNADSLVYIST